MYFILKSASFPDTIGTIDVKPGEVNGGGSSDGSTPSTCTFTIKVTNPTSGATVTLTAPGYTQSGNSITVPSGTTVNWSVSATGYTTKTGTKIVSITSTQSVSLVAEGSSGGSGGDSNGDDSTTTPTGTYYFKDQANIGYLRGGQYIASAKSATTDYIDISSKPKIGYYGRMGYVSGDTFHALEFYDENKTYLSDLSVLGTGQQMYVNIDLSESKYVNAKYVRASVSQSSFTTEQFNTWYFVVGSFIEEAPTLDTVISMFPSLGYIGLDGNNVEVSSNAYVTDYVSLSGKNNIVYKGRMGTIGLNIAFYDSSKKLISGLETIGNGNFITLNINLSDSKYANAAYVKASISKGTLDETTWLSSSFKIS